MRPVLTEKQLKFPRIPRAPRLPWASPSQAPEPYVTAGSEQVGRDWAALRGWAAVCLAGAAALLLTR